MNIRETIKLLEDAEAGKTIQFKRRVGKNELWYELRKGELVDMNLKDHEYRIVPDVVYKIIRRSKDADFIEYLSFIPSDCTYTQGYWVEGEA